MNHTVPKRSRVQSTREIECKHATRKTEYEYKEQKYIYIYIYIYIFV